MYRDEEEDQQAQQHERPGASVYAVNQDRARQATSARAAARHPGSRPSQGGRHWVRSSFRVNSGQLATGFATRSR